MTASRPFPIYLEQSYLDTYVERAKVAQGTYGTIYKVEHIQSRKLFVSKLLKRHSGNHSLDIELGGIEEIVAMANLKHENILTPVAVYMHPTTTIIYPYYMCDLWQFHISSRIELAIYNSCIKQIMKQLLSVLAYMHSHGFIHRDIKPCNILINKSSASIETLEDANEILIKLIDFGMCRMHNCMSIQEQHHEVCTVNYRPPECFLGQTYYSGEIDIWSAGCIFAELLLGQCLFDDQLNVFRQQLQFIGTPHTTKCPELMMQRDYDAIINFIGGQTATVESPLQTAESLRNVVAGTPEGDLLWAMLNPNPSQRISAAAALQHPYFTDFGNTLVRPITSYAETQLSNLSRMDSLFTMAMKYPQVCGENRIANNTMVILNRAYKLNECYGWRSSFIALDFISQAYLAEKVNNPAADLATVEAALQLAVDFTDYVEYKPTCIKKTAAQPITKAFFYYLKKRMLQFTGGVILANVGLIMECMCKSDPDRLSGVFAGNASLGSRPASGMAIAENRSEMAAARYKKAILCGMCLYLPIFDDRPAVWQYTPMALANNVLNMIMPDVFHETDMVLRAKLVCGFKNISEDLLKKIGLSDLLMK
jgi:serine/threonine protein kinase